VASENDTASAPVFFTAISGTVTIPKNTLSIDVPVETKMVYTSTSETLFRLKLVSVPDIDLVRTVGIGKLKPLPPSIAVKPAILVGHRYTGCGVTAAKKLLCWSNPVSASANSELNVHLAKLENVVSAAVSSGSVFAITSDAKVYNVRISFNENSADSKSTLTEVPTLAGSKKIVGGDGGFCAITQPSRVKCWGNNSYGNVGLGTFTNNVPLEAATEIPGLENVRDIAGGWSIFCATLNDNSAKCWGGNIGTEVSPLANAKCSSLPMDAFKGVKDVRDLFLKGTVPCYVGSDRTKIFCGIANDVTKPYEIVTTGIASVPGFAASNILMGSSTDGSLWNFKIQGTDSAPAFPSNNYVATSFGYSSQYTYCAMSAGREVYCSYDGRPARLMTP
ncbi:MAG: hypothetical protein V4692_16145, partial [Bdellovibrionota bacterium]